jgi:uncharacterized protein
MSLRQDRSSTAAQGLASAPHDALALGALWAMFVVVALLLLPVVNGTLYGILVPTTAIVLALFSARSGAFRSMVLKTKEWHVDATDLVVIGGLYLVVVGLFKLAFGVFGIGSMWGLFLSFGGALIIGVAGPIVYTVWFRHRPLASLGLGMQRLGPTILLGLGFAAVQFMVTLWGYKLPTPIDWVPLLLMQITVGFFEAVFFRGFIQGTLERSTGAGPALLVAAALYALYHVGYGMNPTEMVFLFGLGVVYTVAFRITGNVLAIWPLLTPLGGFFNQVHSGQLNGQLPWMSMLGFGDVLGVMAIVIVIAVRYQRRQQRRLKAGDAGGSKLAAAG